jgi:TatD DNase family protein
MRRMATPRRLVDIGANLLDPQYSGRYRGGGSGLLKRHGGDLGAVLGRARAAGVARIILTCGSLAEARSAQQLLRSGEGGKEGIESTDFGPLSADDLAMLTSTVGVHPTRVLEFVSPPESEKDESGSEASNDFESQEAETRAEEYMRGLCAAIREGGDAVVAVGEFGLDYDRVCFLFGSSFCLCFLTPFFRDSCDSFFSLILPRRKPKRSFLSGSSSS